MWNTEITRQLGIKLPFVGAGMAIVGAPELSAAVSNAGGGPGKPEMLADRIDSTRRLIAAPLAWTSSSKRPAARRPCAT